MMPEDEDSHRPSLLPFDPADLVAMRVRPAEFARMVRVSKQSVSQWIKQGKVTLGPDGRLDPHKAARDVLQRTDPARIRARLFKDAMSGNDELRNRARNLDKQLADQRIEFAHRAEWIEYATRNQCADEQAHRLASLTTAISDQFDALTAARATGELPDWLDALVGTIFYPEPSALAVVADAENNSPHDPAEKPQELDDE